MKKKKPAFKYGSFDWKEEGEAGLWKGKRIGEGYIVYDVGGLTDSYMFIASKKPLTKQELSEEDMRDPDNEFDKDEIASIDADSRKKVSDAWRKLKEPKNKKKLRKIA